MRFLGPHSAGEGPHLVPISLKFGSPSGPHFEKSGSPGLVGTVEWSYIGKGGQVITPSVRTRYGAVELYGVYKIIKFSDITDLEEQNDNSSSSNMGHSKGRDGEEGEGLVSHVQPVLGQGPRQSHQA